MNRWLVAAVQFTIAAVFMLVFGFPKWMIGFFGAMILFGSILSIRIKTSSMEPRSTPPVVRPVLFRVLGIGIAICSVAIFSILLFGFVIFMNSWNRWHRYEGQAFRRADFTVTRVFYQKRSKGYDVYANGTVDGQREWMGLHAYLHSPVRSQHEVEQRVPAGTSIPVYLFPDMKGWARVQLDEGSPPAEASHRAAMNALNNSLIGLGLAGGLLLVLTRVRRSCLVETGATFSQLAAQGH
jgi:hypothetical protein